MSTHKSHSNSYPSLKAILPWAWRRCSRNATTFGLFSYFYRSWPHKLIFPKIKLSKCPPVFLHPILHVPPISYWPFPLYKEICSHIKHTLISHRNEQRMFKMVKVRKSNPSDILCTFTLLVIASKKFFFLQNQIFPYFLEFNTHYSCFALYFQEEAALIRRKILMG